MPAKKKPTTKKTEKKTKKSPAARGTKKQVAKKAPSKKASAKKTSEVKSKAPASKKAQEQQKNEEPKKVSALYKNAASSPQKARLVADLVRGKDTEEAQTILKLTNKKAAKIMKKVLDSAVANAEHNDNLDKDSLYISRILVDDGIKYRRYRIVSRGRVHGYVRRRCHILVELSERK